MSRVPTRRSKKEFKGIVKKITWEDLAEVSERETANEEMWSLEMGLIIAPAIGSFEPSFASAHMYLGI
jgi:hypothetical protein